MDGNIHIGDIVEVVDKAFLNGIRYRVEKIVPSGYRSDRLVHIGPIVRCSSKSARPMGYTVKLWGIRLKVVDSTNRVKTITNRKIFAEKGWGP